MSICLSGCLAVCPSICRSVCRYLYLICTCVSGKCGCQYVCRLGRTENRNRNRQVTICREGLKTERGRGRMKDRAGGTIGDTTIHHGQPTNRCGHELTHTHTLAHTRTRTQHSHSAHTLSHERTTRTHSLTRSLAVTHSPSTREKALV